MTTNTQSDSITTPIFPNITVKLIGHDRNIFAILATVSKALREHGVSTSHQSKFVNEVITSNCHASALNVCFRWVNIT